jgi:cysteine desulfurase family protein (TIGR01976 family)
MQKSVISDRPRRTSQVATTEEIRSHFPALNRIHSGQPVAYFDGPGGTQVPCPVVDRMTDYLYYHNANTHWSYPSSRETDDAINYARQAFADFFNANPHEIVFGHNMTTLTFHLAGAIGRLLAEGDEIIVTELDHHANIAPWQNLQRERGVVIRTAKMKPESGELDWKDLENLITPHTKLLALGAASNALGTINNVQKAVQMAHHVKALVFVDAVHLAAHELIDVRALDCDFLSCSAYKFYGPHLGILYAKQNLLESLNFPKLLPAPDTAPERAETGTNNHEGIVGAGAAVDFLASLAQGEAATEERRLRLKTVFNELHDRGRALTSQLWEGLAAVKNVRLYGPPPSAPRTPTVSFTVRDLLSKEVANLLSENGIFASHGDFYAATVVEKLGVSKQGLVRAGGACYTTPEEIDRLVAAIRKIARTA